jgi:hypothetical protein
LQLLYPLVAKKKPQPLLLPQLLLLLLLPRLLKPSLLKPLRPLLLPQQLKLSLLKPLRPLLLPQQLKPSLLKLLRPLLLLTLRSNFSDVTKNEASASFFLPFVSKTKMANTKKPGISGLFALWHWSNLLKLLQEKSKYFLCCIRLVCATFWREYLDRTLWPCITHVDAILNFGVGNRV